MKNTSLINRIRAIVYSFIVGLLLFLTPAQAHNSKDFSKLNLQTHKISGTVTDATGPLAGVTVSIKGTKMAVSTDFDGRYQIEASRSAILVFSFMGYKTVSLLVSDKAILNVKLQEDATTLQEVRVNAGYYSVKESERTGSIARITAKDIESQPVTNVLATMQGRMAGVNITQTTGTPGGGFEIQIRGQNSLRVNGNSPLYIIDGIPFSSDPIGSGINSPVLPTQPSPLNSINPDQIQSIEVLKDADATAIYGSRGANGVILITTKRGTVGKTQLTGKMSTGTGTVTRFMDLMHTEQYLQMRREAFSNDAVNPLPDYAYDVNGTWNQNRYTNWQKELLGGTAQITNIQASLAGGSAQTQFLLSATINKQTTVLPSDFVYKKGNVNLNLNHESENKKFKTAISLGYTIQDNNQSREDLMREAVTIAPNAPALYTDNGSLNWENNTFNNPLRNLEGKYIAKTNDLIANAMMSYQWMDDLQLKSSFGYTMLNNKETTANPSTRYNPSFGLGPELSTLIAGGVERKSWIIEPQLNWNKTIKNGNLNVLIGGTFQVQKDNQLVQYAFGFPSNNLIYNLASASNILTMMSQETEYKYQAYFGRINYNYKQKYLINLTARRDGSSRFGPGKQFATFGAVGGAWLFSKENLFKENKVLSFGKLRATYGITGNDQIGDYQYLDTYGSSGVNYGNIVGLQATRLFNPEFGWETNKKFEIAVETGFFQDRIFFTAGWYNNQSSNQLTGIPLPGTTGFSSLQANLDATVQNRGLELTLHTVNVEAKKFTWSTNVNLTLAKNTLLEFPDLKSSTYANQFVIGQPLNIHKVYHFTGIDTQTGRYTFEDVNGDGLLTGTEDKTTIKDFNPKYYGGLQNSFKYKNWQLDFLFQFVKQINYNASAYFSFPGSQSNQPTTVVDRWQQPGDTASYQLYTDGANSAAVEASYKYYESDGIISDASYVRLKNVALSYNIPLKDLQCKVFFEGQNVITLTHYNGADPEFKSTGYLPPLRILSAGIQLSF